MLAQQRYALILELSKKEGIVHTADLVKRMGVSSETIRKDLAFLEQQGQLVRVHGGALPAETFDVPNSRESSAEYVSLQIRNTQHMEQKAAIANYAASLIQEHQVIALDYGSTSQMMAMVLKKRFQYLTVITNSIQNALILSECPNFTIILTGGILSKEELALSSDFSPILDHLHIDILFMTVSGVDPVIGLTDQRFSEARIQSQMRQAASRTIVLADSSKFGKSSLVKICALKDVDTIVTDSGLPAPLEKAIKKAGSELVIVP